MAKKKKKKVRYFFKRIMTYRLYNSDLKKIIIQALTCESLKLKSFSALLAMVCWSTNRRRLISTIGYVQHTRSLCWWGWWCLVAIFVYECVKNFGNILKMFWKQKQNKICSNLFFCSLSLFISLLLCFFVFFVFFVFVLLNDFYLMFVWAAVSRLFV